MGKKKTADSLRNKKSRGEKITMVTAYDATFAGLVDEAGIDAILVGDSLGMVVQGRQNTLSVSLEDIIYHSRAVSRAVTSAHIVADMPFMSYQADPIDALKNAGRLLKEGAAESVKLEGGVSCAALVEKMVEAGIPVMGHIGLTPQSVHAMGGFKIQGKSREAARGILRDAKALEDAGAYAVVLEGVPLELARVVTRQLSIPTIGIGAGVDCDGQVLVIYDLLGLNPSFKPKFVRRFRSLGAETIDALAEFKVAVEEETFPAEAETFRTEVELFGPKEVILGDNHKDDDDEASSALYGVPV